MKPHFFQNKHILLGLVYLVILWAAVFWSGLTTAIEIWIGSDIFNHCLFVIPGSFFLIYLKRDFLDPSLVKPNYWLLPFIFGTLLLYAIGLAGDIQLFMHIATFCFLPLSIWCYFGNKISYQIIFPLSFILFSIPFGEEFVPFLQEITADWSVALLNLTGVPIYRSGLYIEIPQGRFLVAEACSGISFFIASVVIGSLYAYLNLFSWKRKLLFVIISILFPIVANAIRVYGIILTGYLTNMEHAVGADHLIYGWIFFSLVIICLIGIGEFIREKSVPDIKPANQVSSLVNTKFIWKFSSVITFVSLVFSIWFINIVSQHKPDTSANNLVLNTHLLSEPMEDATSHGWDVHFKAAYDEYRGYLTETTKPVDVYIAWYPKGRGELISSLNRLYSEKNWTLEYKTKIQDTNYQGLLLETLVNSRNKRLLVHWYVVDGKIFTDNKLAKLYETLNILLGRHIGSGLVALSIATEQANYELDKKYFNEIILGRIKPLSNSFQFN
ncbi:exosortase A [Paraglaciecola sp. L3A3]|uniref:exosortase A n=1 Tax=Paraglaciecola sp. L3A3 TaxID=2686358 RepID=UPI00131CBE75|nr:exosortase A [Paraglaciecola sp. L3A3]